MKNQELAKKFAAKHLAAVGFNPMFMLDDADWLLDQIAAYDHYLPQPPAVTPFDERKKRPRKGFVPSGLSPKERRAARRAKAAKPKR